MRINSNNSTVKYLFRGMAAILLLAAALTVTTYALSYATVVSEGNEFRTGIVSIDLNGGETIIRGNEYLFEPGMTVEKPFYIQNQSTWAVYYKIYLADVEGGLADVLQITILNGEKVLYQGTATSLTREAVSAADDLLLIGERRDLTIRFHYPENGDNDGKENKLTFSLCADAVQEKNNPDREFD